MLERIRDSLGIQGAPRTPELLHSIARAFARIPYENLSKIASAGEMPEPERRAELLFRGHIDSGTGGTCFSLVDALASLLRDGGFEPRLHLGDRWNLPAGHSAITVPLGGTLFLLDPAYLVFEPIPLPYGSCLVGSRRFEWVPRDRAIEAATVEPNGYRRIRYTLRLDPVSPAEYEDAWRRSFEFEMMNYPVLTWLAGGRHIYVRGPHYMVDGRYIRRLDRGGIVAAAAAAGIAREVAERALAALGR